jgi:hypothetical protein
MYSNDGINWTVIIRSYAADWRSVCWSPQLILFVAVSSGEPKISKNGIDWTQITLLTPTPLWTNGTFWKSVCWSPQLGLFVAVADGGTYKAMTSSNGINWTYILNVPSGTWWNVTWSSELGLFIAVGTDNIMYSYNGIDWRLIALTSNSSWKSVCWSSQLGLFVAVSDGGTYRVMISNNGINWTFIPGAIEGSWWNVTWSSQLELFVAVAHSGDIMTSANGISWTLRIQIPGIWYSVCWSPELGIFAAVGYGTTNKVMTSSLKGRPPTSYNVFDSSFNSIDQSGNWTFSNVNVTGKLTTGIIYRQSNSAALTPIDIPIVFEPNCQSVELDIKFNPQDANGYMVIRLLYQRGNGSFVNIDNYNSKYIDETGESVNISNDSNGRIFYAVKSSIVTGGFYSDNILNIKIYNPTPDSGTRYLISGNGIFIDTYDNPHDYKIVGYMSSKPTAIRLCSLSSAGTLKTSYKVFYN